MPYTDEMIANAAADAVGQASPDDDDATAWPSATATPPMSGPSTATSGVVTEMDALVAYLQVLGHLTNAAHARPCAGK